jgi:hypothetical protein
MSHINTEVYSSMPQFLASAVGLRTITQQIPQSMGKQDGNRVIVPAGTIFPSNDSHAVGILLDPVDVTYGDHEGAVIVGGHLYGNRLPAAPADAAKTAMGANGYGSVLFETATGMVR